MPLSRALARWVTLLASVSSLLIAGSARAQTPYVGCNPPCAPGYGCAGNYCVPICQPPCAAGAVCVAPNQCVLPSAPPAPVYAPYPPAGYPTQPYAPYAAPPAAPPDGGWARGAAITGYVGSAAVLALTLATMSANDDSAEDDGDRARTLGIAATATAAVLGPVVATGGASARNHPAVSGAPVLRTLSWIGYVLTIVDAAILIGLSFDNEIANQHILSVGALGTVSILGFALDASASAAQADAVAGGMRRGQLTPTIGFAAGRDGRSGRVPTFGLALSF